MDQGKCQAFYIAATKECLEVDESSVWNNTASFGIIELRIIPNDVILFRMIKAYYSKRPFCARAILAAAPNQTSQAPRHIWRNAENAVALDEISWMDDIAAADSVFVFFAEAQERICGISNAGLHLDGVYFVLCFAVIRENKVNFNIVPLLFVIIVRVEEQTMTVRGKHLRDGVFKKHTLI